MTASRSTGREPYSQLEVVPMKHDDYSRLEKVTLSTEPYSQLEVGSAPRSENTFAFPPMIEIRTADQPPVRSSSRKRRRSWIVGSIIVSLVVICAVLGAVLGTTLSKQNSSSPPQVTDGSPSVASSTTSAVPSSTFVPTMSGTASILAIYSYPTAVSWGGSHLEVFALDSEGDPLWKYRNTTSSWSPQGGDLVALDGTAASIEQAIAAVARDAENVDILVAGTDFGLWHKYHSTDLLWGPGSDSWESQGGIISTAPTVVSWGSDRLDVFAIGAEPRYQLFQKYWSLTGGWSDWFGLPDGEWELFAPSAVAWGPDRLDVFLVDKNTNALHHTYGDGNSWQPSGSYDDLGGYCTSRPVALSRGEGLIDIFVRGGDAGLWQLSYANGAWGKWAAIGAGTAIQAEPEAVSWGSGNIELFAWGADSTLLYKQLATANDVETWTPRTGFQVLGSGLTGPPKAVCDSQGSVDVFAYLQNGQIGHLAWDQTSGAWVPKAGFEILGTV